MDYWKEISKDGFTYSCDMLRVSLKLREDAIESITHYLCDSTKTNVTVYPMDFRPFKYRNLVVIDYGVSSMTVGIGFNGNRESRMNGFLEVNPNKCFNSENCIEDIHNIFSCCWGKTICRWDLAIDFAINRRLVFLAKDQRRYSLEMNSKDDKTEYLGVRNTPGRIKLYNKQIESKLESELTRLELTCNGDWTAGEIYMHIPDTHTIDTYTQKTLDDYDKRGNLKYGDLNSTYCVLIECLKDNPEKDMLFKQLSCQTRKKLKPFIYPQNKKLQFDVSAILEIKKNIMSFVG